MALSHYFQAVFASQADLDIHANVAHAADKENDVDDKDISIEIVDTDKLAKGSQKQLFNLDPNSVLDMRANESYPCVEYQSSPLKDLQVRAS